MSENDAYEAVLDVVKLRCEYILNMCDTPAAKDLEAIEIIRVIDAALGTNSVKDDGLPF